MKKKQRKKGFTLIELIVVIAILGILSTLATPAFTGLRENSEERVCNANISTAVRSILAYSVFEETDINDDIVAIAMAELGAKNVRTSSNEAIQSLYNLTKILKGTKLTDPVF